MIMADDRGGAARAPRAAAAAPAGGLRGPVRGDGRPAGHHPPARPAAARVPPRPRRARPATCRASRPPRGRAHRGADDLDELEDELADLRGSTPSSPRSTRRTRCSARAAAGSGSSSPRSTRCRSRRSSARTSRCASGPARRRTSRSWSRSSTTSASCELIRELIVARRRRARPRRAGEDYLDRDDDRAAAGVLRGRPDRRARRLLLVRHQRPDADRARVLARRRRVEVRRRSTSSGRSSTARRSRRSTGPASAGSCGWRRGSGASGGPTSSSASAASTAAIRSRSTSSTTGRPGLRVVLAVPRADRAGRGRAGGGARRATEPDLLACENRARGDRRERRVRLRGPHARGEEERLSPLAARSYPAVRAHAEDDCALRTPFQRDRDRIVHCKSFRRLKHKTQVFVAPEGDHYRTRLTHTLEVTAISRTVARALASTRTSSRRSASGTTSGTRRSATSARRCSTSCLRERFGREFRHYEHSLRVVERARARRRGLNLTADVRDGILCHSGRAPMPRTLEGRIVRLVDRIAYINHDIDDALRAGVLAERDLPAEPIAVLGADGQRADRPARPRPRRALRGRPATSSQGAEVGEAMDDAADVHVRHGLPRPGGAARGARRSSG